MRVLVSCANGSGTSLMMMRSCEKALKEMGFNITNIQHCSVSEGKGSARNYDVVFTPTTFVKMFSDAQAKGVTIVGVKNPMSTKEIKQHVQEETDLEERFL
ncbi:MAG: PTS sugar transporter subunit IIB [Ligilactobacillus agilis]|uniref:PTS sugar transporter subunit IIB n=1 Tax=Ligilactobacillus agilis TaxID=1601 RepID=UPI00242FD751|nr:PTS sugar transporter subunit IIB [Ligilactobacillus agilis]MCI5760877.1 PTS sugar transporter subunit IIB [Ligilactobacillus agilis]MDY4064215.1 PTS sugar transporter subunit IIB [Ligilactobacillus agilis]